MMILNRRRRANSAFTVWKVTLLFLGAGIWVAGLIMHNSLVTLAALIVIAIAFLLGLTRPDIPEPDSDEDPEGF